MENANRIRQSEAPDASASDLLHAEQQGLDVAQLLAHGLELVVDPVDLAPLPGPEAAGLGG
jgi:hypothetical protein